MSKQTIDYQKAKWDVQHNLSKLCDYEFISIDDIEYFAYKKISVAGLGLKDSVRLILPYLIFNKLGEVETILWERIEDEGEHLAFYLGNDGKRENTWATSEELVMKGISLPSGSEGVTVGWLLDYLNDLRAEIKVCQTCLRKITSDPYCNWFKRLCLIYLEKDLSPTDVDLRVAEFESRHFGKEGPEPVGAKIEAGGVEEEIEGEPDGGPVTMKIASGEPTNSIHVDEGKAGVKSGDAPVARKNASPVLWKGVDLRNLYDQLRLEINKVRRKLKIAKKGGGFKNEDKFITELMDDHKIISKLLPSFAQKGNKPYLYKKIYTKLNLISGTEKEPGEIAISLIAEHIGKTFSQTSRLFDRK